ncbi:hypothetical protein Q2941_37225 [Bradyrhizobium sp. UFLA05-153]
MGNAGPLSRPLRAREALMDFYCEEILKIAFDDSGDFFIDKDKRGRDVVVADHARVQRDRLKVDSLKWIMSKLAPRHTVKKLSMSFRRKSR